ncbi:hypothetical protein [Bdellovibrio sp. KM01]|uniref:hypothetical protein n=1 Tax=Bdellovibrio sp. KM01 TaxID=2748865 RepID=UPI0015E90EF4|nr:hypothetical protein [Bdellovibrio sp. KM01]QLY25706.1 hypothetical protein HW988_01240 [Bdellovibrio sp. KM01]
MFASVRTYRFSPAYIPEINEKLQEMFIPLLEQMEGFISYNWITTPDGQGVGVCVFRDEIGLRESIHLAAEFRKTHFSHVGMTTPEIIIGTVGAHGHVEPHPLHADSTKHEDRPTH